MKVERKKGIVPEDILSKYPPMCAEEGDTARECEPLKYVKKRKLIKRIIRDDSLVDFSDLQ